MKLLLPVLRRDMGVTNPESTRRILVEAFSGDARLQRVVRVVREMPLPLSWLSSVSNVGVRELLLASSTWVSPHSLVEYDSLTTGVRVEITAEALYHRLNYLRCEIMNAATRRDWKYNRGSLVLRVWSNRVRLVEWIQPFQYARFWWSHQEY